jgi:NAD(P)-dependent dehydrogenase (short-subunit alcohol dehydrogenase family)
VTDEAQVEATVRAGVDRFGRLDMAFNNAGIMIPTVDAADEAADRPLQLISQARYQDSFAKTDGDWHFVDRTVLSDGAGDMSHHRRDWQRSGSTSV